MSNDDKASPGIQKVMTRLPGGLRERVMAAAVLDSRSMNGFIVAAITEKLDRADRLELLLNTLEGATKTIEAASPGAQETIDRVIDKLRTAMPGSKVLQ